MRLRHVWISNYKNLKDFSINFDEQEFIEIFVGKNGSGKSNFLEALVKIYDHQFSFVADEAGPGFEYTIRYEIDGTETFVEWKEGLLSIDGALRRTVGKTPQPDNVIVYYSGQNRHVADLVESYELDFVDAFAALI
jgi:recombinational DNA repair ATPase RecF